MTKERTDPERRSRARGPYAKSRVKREAIIDGAIEVFAAHGYNSGSLRMIAEKVGIGQAGIFHHFRDKEDLLLAVLDRRDEWARQIAFGDGEDGLLRGVIRLSEALESAPWVVQLYVIVAGEASSPEHPAHERFRERRSGYRQLLTACLDSAVTRGRYRGTVPTTEAAAGIIALLDGIQLQWLLDPVAVSIRDTMHGYISALVDSVELSRPTHPQLNRASRVSVLAGKRSEKKNTIQGESKMTYTNEELAQRWLAALSNVDDFAPLCAPGTQVWHSNDNLWVSFEEAIENVHKAGGLPPMTDQSYTVTENGFLVQFSGEIGGLKIHNTIIVKTENGLAVSAEEYIGAEQDLSEVIAKMAAAAAAAL